MCRQPSIILADSEPGEDPLPDSIRVFVLAGEKQRDYSIGKLSEVRGVVHGNETAVQLMKVTHPTPPRRRACTHCSPGTLVSWQVSIAARGEFKFWGGWRFGQVATSTPIILRQERKSFTFRKNFLSKIR
jgi:hypothetical protein